MMNFRADPGVCRLCAVPLTKAADTSLDEWCWIDAAGSRFGHDPDVAHLYPVAAVRDGVYDPARNPLGATDPYDALSKMAALMDAAQKATRNPRKASLTPLFWRVAREYSALKVRMDMGLGFHQHQANDHPYTGPPVPYHCGSPAWLRPSGWHCRECRLVLSLAVV